MSAPTNQIKNPRDQTPHIVLVDDDPIFAQLLMKVAVKQRVRLTVISSPRDAYLKLPTLAFDVGLFDYDLGVVTGVQLCNFLQREGRKLPILLVSALGAIEQWRWPASVRKSVAKNAGPYSILAAATNLYREYGRKDGLENGENEFGIR